MPIRITGMNSGLDTESIISELVKAQRTKVDSVKKKQTTLQWKQEAWKELNSKIYKLFQTTLGNMRMASDYSKKVTDVTNPAIADVISGDNAMNANQNLKVESLATTGYMTGAAMEGAVTNGTKLTDIKMADGTSIAEGSTIRVTTGGKTTEISVTSDMTVGSFVQNLKNAGLEANFDEKNKRLHIASPKSGEKNDFTITAVNADGTNALKALGILHYDAAAQKEYEKYANMDANARKEAVDADVAVRLKSLIGQRDSLLKTKEEQEKAIDDSKKAFAEKYNNEDIDTAVANKASLQSDIDQLKATIESAGDSASQSDKDRLSELQEKMTAIESYEKANEALTQTTNSISNVESNMVIDGDGNITASSTLVNAVDSVWGDKIQAAKDIVDDVKNGTLSGSGAEKTVGTDAVIYLNGVQYKGESNSFEVNGLTITARQTGETTLTTRQDTDGIYNIVKNFLKEYNSLINEMDKLYNAEAAKGYEPLTEDEKSELSDKEVEKWEAKIKDAVLRRDSNLSTVSSAMKNIMLQGAMVNGKQMYLSNFGIETLGYFSSGENEKNAYHINGDEDDSAVSSKANDLKAAISSDPDTVIAFFSQLSQNLYAELDKQSRSVEGIRTFGKFYDDKKMQEDYNDYADKIKKQEQKLTAMEDRWYNKFTAMETALAKLQSNQSAISSLLGGM